MNGAEEKTKLPFEALRFLLDFSLKGEWSYWKQSRIRSFRSPESPEEQRCSSTLCCAVWIWAPLMDALVGGRCAGSQCSTRRELVPKQRICRSCHAEREMPEPARWQRSYEHWWEESCSGRSSADSRRQLHLGLPASLGFSACSCTRVLNSPA